MEIMEMKKKDLPNVDGSVGFRDFVSGVLLVLRVRGVGAGNPGGSHCFRAPESLSGTSGRVHGGFLQESYCRTGLWYCWNLRGVGCCRFRDFSDIGCNGAGRRVGIDARLK